MSSGRHGKAPVNDQELIRELKGEIRELREKQTQRIGDWVLGKDSAGRVVLTNSEGREELLTPDRDESTEVPLAAGDPVFSACRKLTSQHAATSGSTPLPTGDWYNELEECPSYWKWDSPVNSLTIPTRSRLIVEQLQAVNPVLIGDRLFANVLFLNGVLHRKGSTLLYEDTAVDEAFQLHDMWTINTQPGDVITFGNFCNTAPAAALTADADGRDTRVEVTEIMSR